MRRAVLLAMLLILAGCGGQSSTAPTETSTPAPTTTSPLAPTGTPTATSTPTATATQTPTPPDNPWETDPITVAINDSVAYEPIQPQVQKALEFWEINAMQTPYRDVKFMLIENKKEADLVIRVDRFIELCGSKLADDYVGCSPKPGNDDAFDEQPVVRIERGYTADSRVTILKHQLGYVLGLTQDSDIDVMDPELNLTNLPQTDAVDKPNPWEKPTVRIYVDYSGAPVPIREDHREQVENALGYYQDGAEGFTPENVTIEQVESADRADITVKFDDRSNIGDRDEISNATVTGSDTDSDGRVERFTEATIYLGYNVEGEYGITSYNLGYWIAYSFAAQPGEYPPPWEQDGITYRDEWWKRA